MKESHTVAPVEPPNPAGKGSISQGPLGNTQNVLQSSPFPSFYSLTPNCVRQRLPLPSTTHLPLLDSLVLWRKTWNGEGERLGEQLKWPHQQHEKDRHPQQQLKGAGAEQGGVWSGGHRGLLGPAPSFDCRHSPLGG